MLYGCNWDQNFSASLGALSWPQFPSNCIVLVNFFFLVLAYWCFPYQFQLLFSNWRVSLSTEYLLGHLFSGPLDEPLLHSAPCRPDSDDVHAIRPPGVVCSTCLCFGVLVTFPYHTEFLFYTYWESSFSFWRFLKSQITLVHT